MKKKLSTGCNFTQTPSWKKQEGKREGSPGIWRVVCVSIVLLFLCLSVPGVGWAEENFFQIINDSNIPVNPNFVDDEGYAVYVSYEGKKFLMDTGGIEENLIENMKAAGIHLDNLDFVFLTHRHPDHTGGLTYIRSKRPSLPTYIPPGGGFYNSKGLIELKDHLRISPNVFLIHTHNESGSRGITDELSLLIKTKKGPYVLNGCSHTGFDTILEESKRVAEQNIFFHSGGTSLNRASETKIRATVKKIKALRVTQVSPSHCSVGDRVQKPFKEIYGTNYIPSILGQKVPLEPR